MKSESYKLNRGINSIAYSYKGAILQWIQNEIHKRRYNFYKSSAQKINLDGLQRDYYHSSPSEPLVPI